MIVEIAFFILAILPWWVIMAWPDKPGWWWAIYLWCCLAWLLYYSIVHLAPGGIINTGVEASIAVFRLSQLAARKVRIATKSPE